MCEEIKEKPVNDGDKKKKNRWLNTLFIKPGELKKNIKNTVNQKTGKCK